MKKIEFILLACSLLLSNQMSRAEPSANNLVSFIAAGKTWRLPIPVDGTASDLEFALERLKELKIASVVPEHLELLKEDQSNFGSSKRYIQKYKEKKVLQSELVLIYDAAGQLTAVNSALVDENILGSFSQTLSADILKEKLLLLAPHGIKSIESAEEIYFPYLGTFSLGYKFLAKTAQAPIQHFEILVVNHGVNLEKVLITGIRDPNLHHPLPEPGLNIYLSSSVSQVCGDPTKPDDLVVKSGVDLGKLQNPPYIPLQKKLAETALQHFSLTDDYFSKKFDAPLLNSGDSGFDLVLDCIGLLELVYGGAHYDHSRASFGFNFVIPFLGYQNATYALDVVAHEFTHAIASQYVSLDNKGLPGAINEHLADFFGETIERHARGENSDPYTIGEDMLIPGAKAKPLRDLLSPANSAAPQPEHWGKIDPKHNPATCIPSQSNDQCGVHILNGMLNRVMIKSAIELGFEKMEMLIYVVMRHRLRGFSDFKDYRHQVLDECRRTLDDADCNLIKTQFTAVGL